MITFSGSESWPPGCSLNFCIGHKFCATEYVLLPPLAPGQVTEVCVSMVSPPDSGIFSGQWRMKTAAGNICGGQLVTSFIPITWLPYSDINVMNQLHSCVNMKSQQMIVECKIAYTLSTQCLLTMCMDTAILILLLTCDKRIDRRDWTGQSL